MKTNLKLTPLVVDLLRQGHAVRFRATGQSMAPTIADGDVIRVEPLAMDAPVSVGDVVLALVNNRLIAHRVIGITGGGVTAQLTLRGDAQASVADCVARRDVLGRLPNNTLPPNTVRPGRRSGMATIRAALTHVQHRFQHMF
ncbi:MAG: S24/S26 family peptidase [Chloracidobacterium sp.]|uniref:S24/S26 family peptidase n=1 Tax=Chloracidobacterium validum TaxID=2821543 RepID=A0ABX8BEA7_9BACT|nr:S24/S26 family peptidase [Chloracidobacterium validum]QUW04356.1 S24/S26 family peptidase [Chloracidobacterium validum]